jgi:hypothetical protein
MSTDTKETVYVKVKDMAGHEQLPPLFKCAAVGLTLRNCKLSLSTFAYQHPANGSEVAILAVPFI